VEIVLAKSGTSIDDLVADARDVPELKPWFESLTREAQRHVALEHFGDRGNLQPVERTDWYGQGRTADWRAPLFDNPVPAAVHRPARRPGPGRTETEVWTAEAEKVAGIYMRDRRLTPYAVWARYNPGKVKQAENRKLLSKNMVAHLVDALDQELLGWDAVTRRLVISGEFRASRDKLLIPRRKPAP
jgi:hypothetical protein